MAWCARAADAVTHTTMREEQRMKRLALTFALVLGVACGIAASAAADQPVKQVYSSEGGPEDTILDIGLCPFEVSYDVVGRVTLLQFFDEDGALAQVQILGDSKSQVCTGPTGKT